MKHAIYIFLVFVLVFFLNLLLYIYVDGYRSVIKTIKYGSDSSVIEITNDDSYNAKSIEERKQQLKIDLEEGLLLDLGDSHTQLDVDISTSSGVILEEGADVTSMAGEMDSDISHEIVPEKIDIPLSEVPDSIGTNSGGIDDVGRLARLGSVEKSVLDMFDQNGFGLIVKDKKDDLLDIAGEYPDEYLQYGRVGFDIYMLTTRKYEEVEGIFTVLEEEMPFALNTNNIFGTRSFYINLDREDNKVRFIFEYKRKVFGIKVLKDDYAAVREIIKKL